MLLKNYKELLENDQLLLEFFFNNQNTVNQAFLEQNKNSQMLVGLPCPQPSLPLASLVLVPSDSRKPCNNPKKKKVIVLDLFWFLQYFIQASGSCQVIKLILSIFHVNFPKILDVSGRDSVGS